ncbi:Xaa-Pro dipeptidase [Pseudoalteromonas sp. S16_S37]|uniref:Xaa-Pro dipeptidase n=1 Tax=Pseudoalteromonas sp. S16_S37 TaxID=2720228 RepID=UPI001680BF02|nr:amidohydrolase family protein [Pseudoalteromonas sp. S16_S37]MBD1581298.1 amidohydrolase family protein [Pseudoalteromonas sp. S16_S37]
MNITIYKTSFLLLLILLATSVQAQSTYIKASYLLDVVSGELRPNPIIEVTDQHISGVYFGKRNLAKAANVIDLTGQTLLPGLMDMHVHLTFSPTRFGYKGLSISAPRAALYGAKHANATLMAGFTTVRNMGAFGYSDIALKQAIDDGDIIGPRLFTSGPAIGSTGGHCDNNLLAPHYGVSAHGVADGPWQAVAKVREAIKYGANTIKVCASGGVMSKGTQVSDEQYTIDEMSAIREEAHRRGIIVAAHAHGEKSIINAITAGIDSIEHASFLSEKAIELAIKNQTYLSMDVFVSDYILQHAKDNGALPESIEKEKLVGKRQRDSFSNAYKRGANIVFGTDAAIFPHGQNAKQFSHMVKYGMSEIDAIRSSTLVSAKMLGLSDSLGQLKNGFAADIIAISANPLANIAELEQVNFVMKQGKVYKNLAAQGEKQ